MKLIMIEGARNVGKTYLSDSIDSRVARYKFPFAKYYNESFTAKLEPAEKASLNGDPRLYYLTLGYDITILDMFKQGLISESVILDRGVLSNIVFGIQSKRITLDEGRKAWDWIRAEYGGIFEIVYIHTDPVDDNRGKDMWTLYDRDETCRLYDMFIDDNVFKIKNDFTDRGIFQFKSLVNDILKM